MTGSANRSARGARCKCTGLQFDTLCPSQGDRVSYIYFTYASLCANKGRKMTLLLNSHAIH